MTGDETWLFHLTSESQQQSMEWHHTHSPTQKKYKISSTKKIMAAIVWDCKGVLLVDFMPQGTKKNAAAYFETLKRRRCKIQNIRRGILRRSVCNNHARTPHYKSSAAVIAYFKLGSFIQSCPQPRPCSQQFPFAFAFKETSGLPEVSWWTGEQLSHHVVPCTSSRILWHWNTKTHTQAKQMPWQRW